MIDPAVLDRYRRVCALLGSPEPGERSAARRRKEKMETDYPGIHQEAYPQPQESDMNPKTPFTLDDLLRAATAPEFAGALKSAIDAMSARQAQQNPGGPPVRVAKMAARFDVDTGYDEDDGEFSVVAAWSERTMDKILETVPVDEYAQIADAVAGEVRTEILRALVAARTAFNE